MLRQVADGIGMMMLTQMNVNTRSKRTRPRVGFRDGNRQRIYALLSGWKRWPYIYTSATYAHLYDYAAHPGVAAVRYIQHINYTYLRIRKDWDRVALNVYSRRWHVSQIEVLWINGNISRAECERIIRKATAPKRRRKSINTD